MVRVRTLSAPAPPARSTVVVVDEQLASATTATTENNVGVFLTAGSFEGESSRCHARNGGKPTHRGKRSTLAGEVRVVPVADRVMGRDDDRVLPRVVLSALSVVTGLVAANVAGHGPWLSVAGSPGGTALLLSGGWVPACGALVFGWSRPRRRMADVTLVASSAWFVGHWATPGTGSSLVFTAGLLLSASAPPVVAWAWLAVPVGRPPTATVRSLLATAAAAG